MAQWIETTGHTLEMAKAEAASGLGADQTDLTFEVIDQPMTGLFGRPRGEWRVRAKLTTPPVRQPPRPSGESAQRRPSQAPIPQTAPTTAPLRAAPTRPPSKTAAKVFLSYRRTDTEPYAHLIFESLVRTFDRGNVFMDLDSIPPGVDFVSYIDSFLESCHVVLVLIGPAWLTVTGADGRRRLDDEQDRVRLEVAAALRRDIRVVPVLLGNAGMPTVEQLPLELGSLAARNAEFIASGRRLREEIDDFSRLLAETVTS